MIAIDSSALSRWLDGVPGDDVARVRFAVQSGDAVLPPVVITEVLSRPGLSEAHRLRVLEFPVMTVRDGYWERAGLMRADLIAVIKKANLADVLIAQSCIDHDIPLITYDRDFRHFVYAGLQLLKEDS